MLALEKKQRFIERRDRMVSLFRKGDKRERFLQHVGEAAAAFEELTLSGKAAALKMQVADAWPNTFRQARFLSAVDYVQTDRLRRAVAQEMQKLMARVDLLLVPSLRDEMLTIGNFAGLPSLTLRAGFVEVSEARSDWAPDPKRPLPKFHPPRRVPHGVTLIGRLFDEGTIARVGLALEKSHSAADWSTRPLPEEWLRYAALDVEVLVELRDALADLVDQRHLGIADELEHPGRSPYLTIMTAVTPSASAMETLKAIRPRGAPMKRLSEVPKSAHTIMLGTPMPSMTPAM